MNALKMAAIVLIAHPGVGWRGGDRDCQCPSAYRWKDGLVAAASTCPPRSHTLKSTHTPGVIAPKS